MTDPYTMSARLCDDHGMVSHERVTDQRPGELPDVTYLGRFNIMRVVHHQEKPLAEPFFCTGSAHIAGQHILCTSPAHDKPRNWVAALDGGPDPANIFDGNGSNVTDRALARAAARLRKIAKRADDYTPAGLRIMLYYEADHLAEAAARPKPEKPAVHDLADPVCSQHEPERGDWGHCDTCAAIDGAGQENQQ